MNIMRTSSGGASWAIAVLTLMGLTLTPLASKGAEVEIADSTGARARLTDGYVDNAGVKIHYHTVGEGPLLVLVHSVGGLWFDWRQQIPSLARTYKVVAMSTRGTDRSDKPANVEDYASARVASDIDAIIRHFGREKAIVMAYDSGGFHAWYFAMYYPQRIERLIAIGSFHPASVVREYATNPAQQKAGEYSKNFQDNPRAGADMAAQRRNPNAPIRPQDTPETHKMRLEAARRTSWEAMMNFYKVNWPRAPYSLDKPAFGGRVSEYPKVTAPTLVIYGRDDVPLLVDGLNDLWKWVDNELTMLVLPGHGHGPHIEIPEFVTPRILDWLATRERSAFVYPPTSPIRTP